MKRVALYVRVSTEEQKMHGLSVNNQIEALKDYAEEHDYKIVGLYNDAGISARKSYKKRPALLQLLEDCNAKKIDLILFTKLDRWFRSVADYYEVQNILDKNKIPWQAIWEDYETVTSSGVFKVNIMLSVAQSEADRTSERIRAVNEYRRLSGECYVGGKAPTGYIKQNKGLIIDESKREAIQAFFNDYLMMDSLDHAIKVMREHGLYIPRQTASRMLKNTAYCGNASGYKCEAFITEEQHKKILQSCEKRGVRKVKDPFRVYLFTGITRCASCGGAFSGSVRGMKSGGKKYLYKFYRCHRFYETSKCKNSHSISELKLERYLVDNLDSKLSEYNVKASVVNKDFAEYDAQIKKLSDRLERIGDRYEDGDISRQEYRDKRQAILNEISDLESKLACKDEPKALPANWKEVYSTLDDTHKRAFWHSIIKTLLINEDMSIDVIF